MSGIARIDRMDFVQFKAMPKRAKIDSTCKSSHIKAAYYFMLK
jgi:hypothetical protein